MANFEIPKEPDFTETIRKFETTDPAHADLFNAVVQELIENDVFLKGMMEEHIKNAQEITEAEIMEWYGQMGGGIDIPEEGGGYITEGEIDAMYESSPDYGAGDIGVPDGDIDEMYRDNPDYGEGDVGIPDSEIDGMYT